MTTPKAPVIPWKPALSPVHATLKAIKALGLKVTREYGEYRIAFKGLSKEREEASAAYTTDNRDALGTAQSMAAFAAKHGAR